MNQLLQSSCRRRWISVGAILLCLPLYSAGFQETGNSALAPTTPAPALLASLPDFVATPDGMVIAPDGDLIVACPNYADQKKPACLIRVDKDRHVTKWVDVPVLPETGIACPMGIDFGPDGDIYVCDNQGWSGSEKGLGRGRILRLRIRDSRIISTTVVAEGMEHPNGVRIRGGYLYVTQSMMPKVIDPSGLLVSAVYRFALDDNNVRVTNTLADKQVIATFLSENRFGQYGADGIVFDRAGNLFVGIFGDGKVYKLTFASSGRLTSSTVFARTGFDYALDPKRPGFIAQATRAKMRTTDGMCVDHQDNIYVADFSNNAIAKITPQGIISVVAQNDDTDGRHGELNQPGEPIVWNGRLVISNFDAVFGPDHQDKVNARHDSPATLSVLELK